MRKRTVIPVLLLLIFLLCFPRTAASAALDGLILWYHSVFPVLLPFLFLSSLLIRILGPDDLPKALTAPFIRLFGCSAYGVFVILAGFLCGFPVGARLSAELYQQKKITREEMCRLQGFANNLSPGFILSYLAAEQMNQPEKGVWFLVQILGAAMLAGIMGSGRKNNRKISVAPTEALQNEMQGETLSFAVIDDCIYGAMNSALRLCAYIMLFAVLNGIMIRLLPVANPAVLLLSAGIEVTNGIHMIAQSSLPYEIKYIAVSALAAFGGWSALAQSAGIAKMDKEMLIHYIKSRVKITLLAILLSMAALLL